jgi:hypothetical protein
MLSVKATAAGSIIAVAWSGRRWNGSCSERRPVHSRYRWAAVASEQWSRHGHGHGHGHDDWGWTAPEAGTRSTRASVPRAVRLCARQRLHLAAAR